jgi:hypothetical protein
MATILVDRGDEQKIIDIERRKWLIEVLVALGANEKTLESEETNSKDYLGGLDLEVWKGHEGTIDILRRGKIVAQWKVPKLILIKESQQKFYYEIHTNEWALPFQMSRGKR